MIEYGKNFIGEGAKIFEPVSLGFPSLERIDEYDYTGTVIGRNAIIRSGAVIYCDVVIGDNFRSGHNIIIREKTRIGDNTVVGNGVAIEGNCTIGDNVTFQSMAGIGEFSMIGDGAFIGPKATLLNDRYPPDRISKLRGPVIEENAVIGALAIVLPGITIGRGSAVAAGSVVTRDVPSGVLAIGSPARIRELPKEMKR